MISNSRPFLSGAETSASTGVPDGPTSRGNQQSSGNTPPDIPPARYDNFPTLYWVPAMSKTASAATDTMNEMLDLISNFYDEYTKDPPRPSIVAQSNHHRQVILGELLGTEASKTFVEVVPKSENTRYTILSTLKRHFLFSQLHDYELEDITDAMHENFAEEGDIIVQEGDFGEKFYIMEEGSVEFSINGDIVGKMTAPGSFGDLALMYNSPRAATIRALEYCTMWTLEKKFFRQAMVTSSSNQNVQLCQFLSKISLFENLGPQSLNQLARSLTKQSYSDKEYIIRQGEIGDKFFVLFLGTVVCTKTDDNGYETELVRLHEGEVFGERALLKKEPRAANVIADGPVECYHLDSNNFTLMLGGLLDRLNDINEFRILRGASIFQSLSDRKLRQLRKILNTYTLFSGQKLSCSSSTLYMIMSGILRDNFGMTYGVGFVTGNLQGELYCGDLTAVSDEVTVISLHRQTLLEHINQRDISTASDTLEPQSESHYMETGMQETQKTRRKSIEFRAMLKSMRPTYALADLHITKRLGSGSFGDVYLAETKKDKNRKVALKCLDKDQLIEASQHHFVKREVSLLQLLKHPFVIEYYNVANTARKVIIVTEYIAGIELWTYMLEHAGSGPYGGIPIEHTTLYAATILLALEHIHDHGFIFRDLKLENVMIGPQGYCKLIDCGFAKAVPFINPKLSQLMYRTFTMCGTAEYMAPEIVLTQGHDRSADFWAFGVLIYELLCQRSPFVGRNQQRTFEKIVHSHRYLSFANKFDAHAKSLLRKLLNPNPSIRLGCLRNGVQDIKEDYFFHDVSFTDLLAQRIAMPYIPDLSDDPTERLHVHGVVMDDPLDLEEELAMESVPSEYDAFFEELMEDISF